MFKKNVVPGCITLYHPTQIGWNFLYFMRLTPAAYGGNTYTDSSGLIRNAADGCMAAAPGCDGGSEVCGGSVRLDIGKYAASCPAATTTSVCTDTPNFWNGYYGCAEYARRPWCAGGAFSPGQGWTGGSRYNYPENNCCICGKPATTATTAAVYSLNHPTSSCTNGGANTYYTGSGGTSNSCAYTACESSTTTGHYRSGCGGTCAGIEIPCTNAAANTYYSGSGGLTNNCATDAHTTCGDGAESTNTPSTTVNRLCQCSAGYTIKTPAIDSRIYGNHLDLLLFSCAACPAGTYKAAAGDATCTTCSAGSVTNTLSSTGATTCTACPAGTYNDDSTVACADPLFYISCPAGTYTAESTCPLDAIIRNAPL
jgi:hypothetical protein